MLFRLYWYHIYAPKVLLVSRHKFRVFFATYLNLTKADALACLSRSEWKENTIVSTRNYTHSTPFLNRGVQHDAKSTERCRFDITIIYNYSRRMCVCVCASLFNASRMWKWLDCRKRSCQASMVYSAQVAKKKRVLFKRRNAMKIIANFFFFKRRECCVAQFSATRCGCTTTRRRRRRARALSFDCA